MSEVLDSHAASIVNFDNRFRGEIERCPTGFAAEAQSWDVCLDDSRFKIGDRWSTCCWGRELSSGL